MIKKIGLMNFMVIFLLFLMVGIIFLYSQYILKPDLKNDEQQVRMNQSSIAETSNDIEQLQAGVDQFANQRAQYERLLKLGFFNPQNRLEIKNRMTSLESEIGALFLQYSISPVEEKKNEAAQEAGHRILQTVMEIKAGALEDQPIYDLLYFLNYGFPGHIEINSIQIKREKEITQPLLRKIGDGEREPLVNAVVNVTWLTMVPDNSIDRSDVGAQR